MSVNPRLKATKIIGQRKNSRHLGMVTEKSCKLSE